MKHTNPVLTFAASAGLVLLLLLSPCSVRNFIQDFLGLQQTEVSNKSKAAVNASICDATETLQILQLKSAESNISSLNVALFLTAAFTIPEISHAGVFVFATQQIESGLPVPFYILYQNLKVAL